MTDMQYNPVSIKEKISLCVIIPICNEKESIVTVVDELCKVIIVISALKRVVLLAVDDFSQDNSIELLKKWFNKQQLHGISLTALRLKYRHGVSNALLKGFKLAATWSPELTLVMDADGQDDVSCIHELVELSSSVNIVCALRGKRSETLLFRFFYSTFQLFMKFATGKSARTNQFCLIKLPVLAHLASLSHIDYLGALLNSLSFSRTDFTVARRSRIAGQSKFGFLDHALTAAIIVSYQPSLVRSLHHCSLLICIILSIVIITTNNYIATILLILLSISVHLWHVLLTKILLRRSFPQPLTCDDEVEELDSSKGNFNSVKRYR